LNGLYVCADMWHRIQNSERPDQSIMLWIPRPSTICVKSKTCATPSDFCVWKSLSGATPLSRPPRRAPGPAPRAAASARHNFLNRSPQKPCLGSADGE
jgi:hypothetical protein